MTQSAQGMQWLLPVTRTGADLVITALPLSLGTGLWVIDGGTNIPKSV